jgi:hypothetical protein
MVKFDFEIVDIDKDRKYTFKNCDRETLVLFTEEESLDVIFSKHYFDYAMYDRIVLLDIPFIVMKSTKKNIVMVKVVN